MGQKYTLSKAVILALSISMVLIFMSYLNGRSGQSASLRIAFCSAMLIIVMAFDVYMWNVLRCGGPRIVFTVSCSEETEYRIRLDGKKWRLGGMVRYRGAIDDEICCKKGRHTLSVESERSVETAEIDVDGTAYIRILIHGDIDIEPDDHDRAQGSGLRLTENRAVLMYAAFCFFMAAMAIIAILFNELRCHRPIAMWKGPIDEKELRRPWHQQ